MRLYVSITTSLLVLLLSGCNENNISGEIVGKNASGSCIEVKIKEGIIKDNEPCLFVAEGEFHKFKTGQKIQAEISTIENTTFADFRVEEISVIDN